jgi:hypothetical protein
VSCRNTRRVKTLSVVSGVKTTESNCWKVNPNHDIVYIPEANEDARSGVFGLLSKTKFATKFSILRSCIQPVNSAISSGKGLPGGIYSDR